MHTPNRIDFEKLLGFELVTRELLNEFDLQEETIAARLGAKVGQENVAPAHKAIEFSKLLGFENVSEGLLQVVDFQNETLGDKLGAKIGPPEEGSPANQIDFQNETLAAKLGAKVGDPEPSGCAVEGGHHTDCHA